jgi:hypothetical protein
MPKTVIDPRSGFSSPVTIRNVVACPRHWALTTCKIRSPSQAAAAGARRSNWRRRATRYRGPPNLDQANPRRFLPLAALDDLRNNSLPFA